MELVRVGAVSDILYWFNHVDLPYTVVPVAVICSILGALVLYPFTRLMGLWTVVLNFIVLFVGAYMANVLMASIYLPLNRHFERPLVISLAGMMVMSVPLLFLLQRRANE